MERLKFAARVIAVGVLAASFAAGECRAAFLDAHWVSLAQPLSTGSGGELRVIVKSCG